jgi:peptidoglycan/LPS O-acetylase OafA/YrhL
VLLYCTGAFHLADIVTWPFIRHHLVQLPTASWWYAGWYFNGYPYAFPAYNGGQYPNLVLWSLTVEINFYLFLPAIIGRLWNRTVSGATGYSLLVWGAISIVFAIWMSWLAQTAPNSDARAILINMVFPHLWIFLTGVAAYLYWHILGRLIVGKFLFWIAAYSALSYYNYRAHGIGILDFDLFSPMIFARVVLLAGCVLSFAYTCPRLSQVLKGNDISYGMYLNHFLIVWVFGDLGITGRAWLWWAVGGLSVLVGYASWRFVERPMLGLKSRFR